MSQERSSSRSPSRRSGSPDKDPKIAQAQANARKGMAKRKKRSFWDKYAYHIVIGGFLLLCGSALFSTFFSKSKKIHLTPIVDQEDIDVHNAGNLGFTLGPNDFFEGLRLSDAKPLFNNQFTYKSSLMRCGSSEESTIIEDNYDFRTKYPKCVNPIVTQGNCSSSYAIATISAVSDRICMQTGENVNLSPQGYLSCANGTKNCEGGAVATVLDYGKKEGFVTNKCIPYSGDKNATCPADNLAGCPRFSVVDYCVASTAEGIKREILKNGPVIAILPVFRDFLVYKDGVYHVIDGTSRFQGGHAIKIVGWGKSPQGVDYWIAENSWGESWGNKGYAHIAVGEKNLYIDEFVMSANPRVAKADDTTTSGSTAGSGSTGSTANVETEDLDSDK